MDLIQKIADFQRFPNWKLQVIPCKWLVERYFGPDPIVAQKAILFFDSRVFFVRKATNHQHVGVFF